LVKCIESKNDRIEVLKTRIKRIEEYNLKNNRTPSANEINNLKQELEDLLKDEAKRDRYMHLPLYSSKSTGYKFFCSPCWDKAF
jgi:hypothetical protein